MFPLYQMKVWVIRQIVKERKCWKKRVYAKKYRSNESVNAKRIRLDKVTEHKKSKKASESSQSVNQSKYLNEFDSMKNGSLHDQCWAKCNMKQFYISMYGLPRSMANY